MKKLTLLFGVMLMAFCVACSKDDNNEPESAQNVVPEQNLVSITGRRTYEAKELPELVVYSNLAKFYFGDETTLKIFKTAIGVIRNNRLYALDTVFANSKSLVGYKRDWHVESYSFTYNSTSAKGEPIVLSGRVSFPTYKNGTGNEVASLSLCTHFLLHGHNQAPTIDDPSPLVMRVLYNSAVVEPDFEGYGLTKDVPFPGFSYETQGMQMIDCARAALQVMRSRGVTLAADGYSTAWGNSMATPGVIGLLKVYDTRITQAVRDQIRLKSAYTGCGPLIFTELLKYYDEHPEYDCEGLIYLPTFFSALPQSIFGGYELKDFFADWMQDYMVEAEGGEEMSYFEGLVKHKMVWNLDLPDSVSSHGVSNFLAADMCTAEGHMNYDSEKVKILLKVMDELCNWGDWTPKEDTYLVHCPEDNFIPYVSSRTFYDERSSSGKLHFKNVSTGVFESLLSPHAASTAVSLFLSMMHEDPASAFKYTL